MLYLFTLFFLIQVDCLMCSIDGVDKCNITVSNLLSLEFNFFYHAESLTRFHGCILDENSQPLCYSVTDSE